MSYLVPLISAVVSLVFALAVLDQYFARRQPYQLVWAIGLLMYCVSTTAEFWTEAWDLNLTVYRLWYLCGAIYVAAYLGMGSVYLLAKRRVAHVVMGVLAAASVYAVVAVFAAPVEITGLLTLSGEAMPRYVRLSTPFFNGFGTVALVGGALYSAWYFWRRRRLRHRVISNVLIAVGAILPALGGTWIRVEGSFQPLYLLELAGIVIIFLGFLRNREVFGLLRFPLVHGFKRIPQVRP